MHDFQPAPLVWIDLEMSGLDPETDVILEIASIVTNASLRILEEGPNLAISQPDDILNGMDQWNIEHHTQSGLIDDVRDSDVTLEEAERRTLDFLKRHVNEPDTAPLCGNSIGHDRRFLYRYMPLLSDFLHYRNVDVSSIKELVTRWYGGLEPPEKDSKHRALADIRESIEELQFYRKHVFVD